MRATFCCVAGPDLGVHFGPPIWVPIGGYCCFSDVCVQTGGFILAPSFWLGNLPKPTPFGLQKCPIKADFMLLFLGFCKRCPRPTFLRKVSELGTLRLNSQGPFRIKHLCSCLRFGGMRLNNHHCMEDWLLTVLLILLPIPVQYLLQWPCVSHQPILAS
jgi:hypothetical protein